MSTLAAAAGPESDISYTWSVMSGPGSVTWSVNGSNMAKETQMHFEKDGKYLIRCTISYRFFVLSYDIEQYCRDIAFTQFPRVPQNPMYSSNVVTVSALAACGGPESSLVYTWELTNAKDVVSWSENGTNAAKTTQITFHKPGFYQMQCTATRGDHLDRCYFDVDCRAIAFDAKPAAAQNVVIGNYCDLSALASSFGPEADIKYTWLNQDQQPPVEFSDNGTNSAKNTRVTFSSPGDYWLDCLASYQGITVQGFVVVSSRSVAWDRAPYADANPVRSDHVTLHALGKTVGTESALTYGWSLVNGPGSVAWSVNNSNAAKATVATFSASGSYKLKCLVTNVSMGGSATELVVVDVHPLTIESIMLTPNPVLGATAQVSAVVSTHGVWPVESISYHWSCNKPVLFSNNNSTLAANTVVTVQEATSKQKLTCQVNHLGFCESAEVEFESQAISFAERPHVTGQPWALGNSITIDNKSARFQASAITNIVPSSISYAWSAEGPGAVVCTPMVSGTGTEVLAEFSQPGYYYIVCAATCGGVTARSAMGVTNRMLGLKGGEILELVSERMTTTKVLKEFHAAITADLASAPVSVEWLMDGDLMGDRAVICPDPDPSKVIMRCLVGAGKHTLWCRLVQGALVSVTQYEFIVENDAYFSLLDRKSWSVGANLSGAPPTGTLQRLSPGFVKATVGESVRLKVKTLSGIPVVCVSLRGGVLVSSGLMVEAIMADGSGVAQVDYCFKGDVMEVLALSGGDRVRFVVYKK